jgi:predicted  nucleic acid-binding Zn-ribbon protein
MPNKCTGCGKVHPDDAPYLLKGCDKCSSKFFFYVREESLNRAEKDINKLSKKDMKEIEDDIRFIIPEGRAGKDETVVLDVEAIRVIKPGKYKIDVTNLFMQRPIVIRVGSGKYELDLSTLLTKIKSHIPSSEKSI